MTVSQANPPSPQAAEYFQNRPILPLDSTFRLTLTGSSAASTNNMPAGFYEVRLITSGVCLCYAAFANSATVPTSGADAASGTLCLSDGDVIEAPGGAKFAAILSNSGTGELALVGPF